MWFIIGFASGFGIFSAALVCLCAYGSPPRTAKSRGTRPDPMLAEKLALARRYLGLIANRETITEARKIATKALQDTE